MLQILLLLCLAALAASLAGVSHNRSGAPAQRTVLFHPATQADEGSVRRDDDGRIINGTKSAALTDTSPLRSVGYVVAFEGAGRFYLCGGTFVTPRHVVTAAHCMFEGGVKYAPTSVFVTSGRSNVADVRTALQAGTNPAQIPALIPVTAVDTHPQWDERTYRNDAAVLTTARDAALPPTLLAGAGEPGSWGGGQGRPASDTGAWIGGWGDTDYGFRQVASDDLMEARIPIHPDATCRDAMGQDYDPTVMLCAGVLDTDESFDTSNGVDSCQGDSGGPLLAPVADGSQRLVGIVSFGPLTCASSFEPGTYTRIEGVRSWIEGITGPASGTTSMPAGPVAGGGGSGGTGDLRITSPAEGVRVGLRGATTVAWSQPTGVVVRELAITGRSGATTTVPVPAEARSLLLGHARLNAGSNEVCIQPTLERDPAAVYGRDCVTIVKGAQFAAGVLSATYRRGRITLVGRVVSTARHVRIRVKVTGGRRSATSSTRTYTVPVYPAGRRYVAVVPWRGRTPKAFVATTTVTGGGSTASFRTLMR